MVTCLIKCVFQLIMFWNSTFTGEEGGCCTESHYSVGIFKTHNGPKCFHWETNVNRNGTFHLEMILNTFSPWTKFKGKLCKWKLVFRFVFLLQSFSIYFPFWRLKTKIMIFFTYINTVLPWRSIGTWLSWFSLLSLKKNQKKKTW